VATVRAIVRNDFSSFLRRCMQTLNPSTRLFWNWHIEAMAYRLEQVRLGKITRLIINIPPRSLKSTVGSVAFPAFVLGHDPAKRLIAISYGSDLAVKHANDFRSVITARWYRELFPAMRISSLKNTETEVVTTRGGYRLTTSVDGTLTGRGGDIIVIDDPLKPVDAMSESKRERVNQWFFNTLLSRLDDKQNGAIVLVMQRLHVADLAGVLLRGSEEWTHLCLPAIAEQDEEILISDNDSHFRRPGKLLHPERESMAVLDRLKAQVGSDIFAAQYQQSPVLPGGAMIKRKWIGRYDQLPTVASYATRIQSWDTANKNGSENAWSVCTTWLLHESRYYLVDVVRGRFDYPTLKARVIAHAKLHNPSRILIEDAGVGTALVQELRNAGHTVTPVTPDQDKTTRMSIESAKFENGQVFFPNHAPWLADLESELFAFPHSRHDDQIDSVSQALANAKGGYDSSLSWVGSPY
jgi:predicted phage terminase large subunit-like protein